VLTHDASAAFERRSSERHHDDRSSQPREVHRSARRVLQRGRSRAPDEGCAAQFTRANARTNQTRPTGRRTFFLSISLEGRRATDCVVVVVIKGVDDPFFVRRCTCQGELCGCLTLPSGGRRPVCCIPYPRACCCCCCCHCRAAQSVGRPSLFSASFSSSVNDSYVLRSASAALRQRIRRYGRTVERVGGGGAGVVTLGAAPYSFQPLQPDQPP
jgi:hypothetical protein